MYYAEFNTDHYIREKFFPNFSETNTMAEIGAGPPVFYSMSKHFRDHGWRCICVDPNPKFIEQHKRLNHEIYQYACSNEEKISQFQIINTSWNDELNGISYSSINPKYDIKEQHTTQTIQVPVIKLDTLLSRLNIKTVDLISIDTEGYELEVMKGFNVNLYKPKVILLENYLHDNEYTSYMEQQNYALDKVIEYNYIFTKI
jgi:FkbM family methyltransferase